MNEIVLNGVLKNIEFSHSIDGVAFNKADLICKRSTGQEDIINLRFKAFSNKYQDNDIVMLKGNVRSYSHKTEDNKNKVLIYVFTYFDLPDESVPNGLTFDGRICKMNELRKTRSGKQNLHFIVANNLVTSEGGKRLNSYIPCIAWGDIAKELSKLPVNTKIVISGELHSREHTKIHENGQVEIRVAHEVLVQSFEVVE